MTNEAVSESSRRRLSANRFAVILVVLGFAIGIAACGGSAPKPTVSSNTAAEFAHCMRSHRVPNFPDPTRGAGGGEGFSIAINASGGLTVDGIPFSGPAFQSASRICDRFDDVFGAPAQITETQKAGMTANARCIRAHGIPTFPDPTFGRGVGINLPPGLNPGSPAIERAAKACADVGVPIPGVGVG